MIQAVEVPAEAEKTPEEIRLEMGMDIDQYVDYLLEKGQMGGLTDAETEYVESAQFGGNEARVRL